MMAVFMASTRIPVCIILYKDEYKTFSVPYYQIHDAF